MKLCFKNHRTTKTRWYESSETLKTELKRENPSQGSAWAGGVRGKGRGEGGGGGGGGGFPERQTHHSSAASICWGEC